MICKHCQVDHDPALCPSHISGVPNSKDFSNEVSLRQMGEMISVARSVRDCLVKVISTSESNENKIWRKIAEERWLSLERVERENHELKKIISELRKLDRAEVQA